MIYLKCFRVQTTARGSWCDNEYFFSALLNFLLAYACGWSLLFTSPCTRASCTNTYAWRICANYEIFFAVGIGYIRCWLIHLSALRMPLLVASFHKNLVSGATMMEQPLTNCPWKQLRPRKQQMFSMLIVVGICFAALVLSSEQWIPFLWETYPK